VLKELPAKIQTVLPVRVQFDLNSLSNIAQIRNMIEKNKPDAEVSSARQQLGLAKVDIAAEWILNAGCKVVAFCWHRSVVEGLADQLSGNGHNVGVVLGAAQIKTGLA